MDLAAPARIVARALGFTQKRAIETLPWLDPSVPYATRPADLAAVMHATRLITEPLSGMVWAVRASGRAVDPPRWITDPQLTRPDDRYPVGDWVAAAHRRSRMEFWSEWITDCLWNGAGFLLFQSDSGGAPMPGTLRVIPSAAVQISGAGSQSVWRVALTDGTSMVFDRNGRLVGAREFRLILMRGEPPYDPHTGRGLGVLQRAARDLELHNRIQGYSSGIYRSGTPSGYLKTTGPDMDQPEVDALKAAWEAAHASADQRRVAVLNATVDYVPVSISPEDMAVVESKRLSLLDVALAFGVPAYMLGAQTNTMTYSNVEMEYQNYISGSLAHWAQRIESVLSPLLPAGREIDLDFRSMMRGDSASRVSYWQAMTQMGVVTAQQVAVAEGFDPAQVPGLQEPEPEPDEEEVTDDDDAAA